MKKILTVFLAVMMMASLAACGGETKTAETAQPAAEPAAVEETNEIVYGTSADYPPFEFIYLDDKGEQQYAGIDVSLAQQIADDMGKELRVVNMNFDSLMASLQKGEVDFVIAAMEATEERLNAADFSAPYYTDYPSMVLVKAANADQYTDLASFAGKSVGAQTGTMKAEIVLNDMTGANFVGLTTVSDLVNELVYDKCDAIVLDGAVALQYAAANEDLVVADVSLGEAYPYAVAVSKGDPKGLLESINGTVAAALENGTIDQWIAAADELSAKAIEE